MSIQHDYSLKSLEALGLYQGIVQALEKLVPFPEILNLNYFLIASAYSASKSIFVSENT